MRGEAEWEAERRAGRLGRIGLLLDEFRQQGVVSWREEKPEDEADKGELQRGREVDEAARALEGVGGVRD